jgi:hypothetical protein
MFATYFEWKVKPGHEEVFVQTWTAGTEALQLEGSFGSSLFKGKAGHFHAFARWPDQATRDAAFARSIHPDNASAFRDCIETEIQRVDMDEIQNMWSG